MAIDLKDYIASIPDYPTKGILFRDVTPLVDDGERNGHHAYAVGSKVYVEAFGFVLREHRDVLLHAHAKFQQGARHLPDATCSLWQRSQLPAPVCLSSISVTE